MKLKVSKLEVKEMIDRHITAIVEDSLRNLEKENIEDIRRSMTPRSFFEEYQHLIIKGQRQQGTTTAAVDLLYRHENSLMFVGKQHHKKHITNNPDYLSLAPSYIEPHSYLENRVFCMNDSINYLFKEKLRGRYFDFIILDNAYYQKNNPVMIQNLSELISNVVFRSKLFIELG